MFRNKLLVSWQSKLVFLIIWFIFASFAFNFWRLLKPADEWETIENTYYGFTIDYPSNWSARTYGVDGHRFNEEEKLQINHPIFNYGIIHGYYQGSQSPTLSDVAKWGESRMNRFRDNDGFEEHPLIEDQMNGHKILRRWYRIEKVVYEDIYIARTMDMIIITFASSPEEFEKNYDMFEMIVNSFRPIE